MQRDQRKWLSSHWEVQMLETRIAKPPKRKKWESGFKIIYTEVVGERKNGRWLGLWQMHKWEVAKISNNQFFLHVIACMSLATQQLIYLTSKGKRRYPLRQVICEWSYLLHTSHSRVSIIHWIHICFKVFSMWQNNRFSFDWPWMLHL